jgi:hypothetical protein
MLIIQFFLLSYTISIIQDRRNIVVYSMKKFIVHKYQVLYIFFLLKLQN